MQEYCRSHHGSGVSCSVVSNSLQSNVHTNLLCPWNSPGQNAGVDSQPLPSPRDLPDPSIKPKSPALQVDSLPSEPPGKPWKRTKAKYNDVSIYYMKLATE